MLELALDDSGGADVAHGHCCCGVECCVALLGLSVTGGRGTGGGKLSNSSHGLSILDSVSFCEVVTVVSGRMRFCERLPL